MPSIYDITGDRYFTPLASKNRKVYIDTILFLHRIINELFESKENDKARIVKILADHLDDMVSIRLYSDETGDELLDKTDNYMKASIIINNLEDYGWLVEESVGNGRRALDFNSHSYSFIELIEKLIENRKPQYTSYIRIVNNTIYNFDYRKTDDLYIVDNALADFVVALRGLRSDIQRYYKNITKNKNSLDLETLLDEFTGEYKEYFFDSSYLNLKIRDNVDNELPRISRQLDLVFSDYFNMEKLINTKMQEKGFEDYKVASKEIKNVTKRISSNLNTISSIIEMIDSKNEKYVQRTVSVIIHLITRGEDIEGVLHRLIDYVKDNDDFDSYISLFEMKHYGFNALSKPRKQSVKMKPEMMALDFNISLDARKKTLEILNEDKKYNIHAVNDFVIAFLGDSNRRNISTLEIKSKFELIMLVSIMIYSKLPNSVYTIELLEDRITRDGVTFNDFIVSKKGGTLND